MPTFLKYFLWSLLLMAILTYVLAWFDIINNQIDTGNWFKTLLYSFKYWAFWFVNYILIILVVATVLTLLGLGIKFGIGKLK